MVSFPPVFSRQLGHLLSFVARYVIALIERTRNEAGFGLVEMVISVALLALVICR